MSSSTEPSVRRRPRDRRSQILTAAAYLFHARGYRQVSMADVAGEVRIGASALYRHFPSKADLLVAVLDRSMARLEAAIEGRAGPDLVAALVAASLDGQAPASLWRRDVAELPPGAAVALRSRRRAVLDRLREASADGSPPRARAALAVCESGAHPRGGADRDRSVQLLTAAATACLTVPLPPPSPGPTGAGASSGGLLPHARGEAVQAIAGRLFAERGYPAVSLEQIGAATGMAGPSIYKHFPSKTHLLTAILRRGTESLWFALHGVLAGAVDDRDALSRVVDSYLGVLGSGTGAVSVLLTEVVNLPDEPRAEFRASQQRYVAEWVALLVRCRGDADETAARVLVIAALAVANVLTHQDPLGLDGSSGTGIGSVGILVRAVLGLEPSVVGGTAGRSRPATTGL